MRNNFSDYYPPTAGEYESLWRDAIIILDTNVLLNLYRLPAIARDELFEVLELLKDRLWIPHHVALEFQQRRLTVISTERKSIETALNSANSFVVELKKKIDELQLDKRGLGIDPKTLTEELDRTNLVIASAIETAHASQLDISAEDPIRERIDLLFGSKVGDAPISQEDLNELIKDGEERYKDRIPPGFMDSEKEKNPNEAVYIYNKMKYQRKFGDLILWLQIINHVKKNKIPSVLFITSDQKDDWWHKEFGKTISPHRELLREIKRDGGVTNFWMYSSVQFVEHANKYIAAKVSKNSLEEIKNIAMLPQRVNYRIYDNIPIPDSRRVRENITREVSPSNIHPFYDSYQNELFVGEWLIKSGLSIEQNGQAFPDFIVQSSNGIHGYEVKSLRGLGKASFLPSISNSILRGYAETSEGRLSAFSLVIVIPMPDDDMPSIENQLSDLYQKLSHQIKKYPIHSIIIGFNDTEEFTPIMFVNNMDEDNSSHSESRSGIFE